MYNLTVNHISASGNAALVTITKKVGFVLSTVANGWIRLTEPVEKGATQELPATTKVSMDVQKVANEETGEITEFNWVVLS